MLLSQKLLKVSNILYFAPTHTRRHYNATRQWHCQWRCGPADTKHAKRCYHFLLIDKTIKMVNSKIVHGFFFW